MYINPPISQQRLCQPYGDDQRRGLWLYHILEPLTWFKLVKRVCGANSGALYIEEKGNMTGYDKIQKPAGHTWKSFCSLLLNTLPPITRDHFVSRFGAFITGWKGRGYVDGIPDEAPKVLEDKHWAPSWRRLCKVILRNDHWCKGLGLTQPKSEAYAKYMRLKNKPSDKIEAALPKKPRERKEQKDIPAKETKFYWLGFYNLRVLKSGGLNGEPARYAFIQEKNWTATFTDSKGEAGKRFEDDARIRHEKFERIEFFGIRRIKKLHFDELNARADARLRRTPQRPVEEPASLLL